MTGPLKADKKAQSLVPQIVEAHSALVEAESKGSPIARPRNRSRRAPEPRQGSGLSWPLGRGVLRAGLQILLPLGQSVHAARREQGEVGRGGEVRHAWPIWVARAS